MTGLFAGTAWERPPRCDGCGELEAECRCPPPQKVWLAPDKQTAKVRLEKRKAGRVVTVVANLNADESDLKTLLKRLKDDCGSGGSLQDEHIELQGDHVGRVSELLRQIGYRVR